MELDDLKETWQRLEHELQEQKRINLALHSQQASSRVQSSLKPLVNWQILQIVFGIAIAGLGAQFWIPRMDQTLFLVAGVIVHIYGVALVINGVRVLMRLFEIDYGAPVTTLQKQIARLEQSYIVSGWIVGLPWWLLWIPMALIGMALAGADVSHIATQSWLPVNIGVGVVGMLLTVAGYHWARRSTRPGLRAQLDRLVGGTSIDNAKRLMSDIEQFERHAE